MKKNSRADIKKRLDAMKGPKPYEEIGSVSGGKKQAAKLMADAVCGKGYKQKM